MTPETKQEVQVYIAQHCPVCGRHLRFKAEDAGKRGRCGECYSPIRFVRKQPVSYRPPPGERVTIFRSFFGGLWFGLWAALFAAGLVIVASVQIQRHQAEAAKPAATSPQK